VLAVGVARLTLGRRCSPCRTPGVGRAGAAVRAAGAAPCRAA